MFNSDQSNHSDNINQNLINPFQLVDLLLAAPSVHQILLVRAAMPFSTFKKSIKRPLTKLCCRCVDRRADKIHINQNRYQSNDVMLIIGP